MLGHPWPSPFGQVIVLLELQVFVNADEHNRTPDSKYDDKRDDKRDDKHDDDDDDDDDD